VEVGGQYYDVVYGASIAAPIWKDLMETAQHGLPSRPLP
jgi:membrane carboxypeptidase/penicillin-binding protein